MATVWIDQGSLCVYECVVLNARMYVCVCVRIYSDVFVCVRMCEAIRCW